MVTHSKGSTREAVALWQAARARRGFNDDVRTDLWKAGDALLALFSPQEGVEGVQAGLAAAAEELRAARLESLERLTGWNEANKRIRELLAAAPRAGVVETDAERIKEVLAGGDGVWRTCSGCYETEDGQNVHGYPRSKVFGDILGAGCGECGGLGVIWDTTDYGEMADFMARDLAAPPAVPDPYAELVGAAVKYRDINRNGSGVGWAARRSKAVLELISAADRLIETNTVSAVNIDTPPNK